jgi:membrane protein
MTPKRWWFLLRHAWRQSGQDNCTQMAAAIAYHVLFAVVPLTMLVISVVGLIAGSEQRRDDVVDEAMDYLRLTESAVRLDLSDAGVERVTVEYGKEAVEEIEQGLDSLSETEEKATADDLSAGEGVTVAGYELTPEDVEVNSDNLVVETVQSVIDASGPISVLSLVLVAYSATGLFGAVRRSLDFVWGRRRMRPMFEGKLMDLVMVVFVLALVIAGLVAIAMAGALRQVGTERGWLWSDWAWTPGSIAFSWVVSFGVCLLAFRFIPQAGTRFRNIWPGAALAATGFEVIKLGFGLYVANFSSFDVVYGALGGVLLVLLFVYWASYLFLLSAEVSVAYPRAREGRYDPAPGGQRKTLRQEVLDGVKGLFVRGGEPVETETDGRR